MNLSGLRSVVLCSWVWSLTDSNGVGLLEYSLMIVFHANRGGVTGKLLKNSLAKSMEIEDEARMKLDMMNSW